MTSATATLEKPTLETPPVQSTRMNRVESILASVDGFLAAFDAWQSDPRSPNEPTRLFEEKILEMFDVAESGDIPNACRELCVVVIPRLKFEWEQYTENYMRRKDDTPLPRFWAAFDALVIARQVVQPFVVRRPPPVKDLLDVQKVSQEQIAWYIYGQDKKGPFVQADGSINYAAIRREADNPGSVIPLDWTPPWEEQRRQEWEATTARQINASAVKQNDRPDAIDETSIEELLRRGDYPAAVAQMKNVPIEEVLRVARKCKIPVSSGAMGTSEVDGKKPDELPQSPPASASPAAPNAERLEQRIIELSLLDHGAPEIAAKLKEEGFDVTAKQIAAMLNKSGGK